MFGLDYLGGCRFGDLILREHPAGFAAGFFSNTFGDAMPVVERLVNTGRCPRVRLHAMWKDRHDFTPRDFPEIIKEVKRIARLAQKYPAIDWRISPACEHGLNQRDALTLLTQARDAAPNCLIVNTPDSRGALVEGFVNEIHGFRSTPPNGNYNIDFSFDGKACVDSDVESYKSEFTRAATFYFWEPRFNGRWEDNDKTPRPQRKGWPDSKLIDSVIYLHRDRGAVSLPAKWIYKSHAENKGPDKRTGKIDPRAEKPCIIAPIKTDRINLVTANGQVVSQLKYYDIFSSGGFRYYDPNNWGFEIAEKARRIQGHSLVTVKVNGKAVGIINPGFRAGAFR